MADKSMERADKNMTFKIAQKFVGTKRVVLFFFIVFLSMLLHQQSAFAGDASVSDVPTRYGHTVVTGNSYDPKNNITFVQISGFALFDHEKIIPHKAPEALRFKFEGSLGSMIRPEKRLIVSANIFSLYYMNALATKTFKPYVEGGIGAIYTDYRWEGQSARFNFNPQLGVGTEINMDSGQQFMVALRLYHVSNAGLNRNNRGLNAVTLHMGRFF